MASSSERPIRRASSLDAEAWSCPPSVRIAPRWVSTVRKVSARSASPRSARRRTSPERAAYQSMPSPTRAVAARPAGRLARHPAGGGSPTATGRQQHATDRRARRAAGRQVGWSGSGWRVRPFGAVDCFLRHHIMGRIRRVYVRMDTDSCVSARTDESRRPGCLQADDWRGEHRRWHRRPRASRRSASRPSPWRWAAQGFGSRRRRATPPDGSTDHERASSQQRRARPARRSAARHLGELLARGLQPPMSDPISLSGFDA